MEIEKVEDVARTNALFRFKHSYRLSELYLLPSSRFINYLTMRVGTYFAAAVLLVTSVFAVEVGEYRSFLIHRRHELISVLSFFQ